VALSRALGDAPSPGFVSARLAKTPFAGRTAEAAKPQLAKSTDGPATDETHGVSRLQQNRWF
jgi:hypothetical protein